MDLDCLKLFNIGSNRSCSGDSMAGRILWLLVGDFWDANPEVGLLAGDDYVEPKASILSSICVIQPLKLCNSFNICALVSIGNSLSLSVLQFLLMGPQYH